ncbi:hypothetical protein ABH945_005718 [Paraburkholderia sp. GAS333]|uniref:hypothetical protein n=1 Tax=Paraburkholderia sp. GAS333 TaxID=3156279 RepID=UPI003D1CD49A
MELLIAGFWLITACFERWQAMADSTGGCNTLKTAQAVGVLQMKQRRRIYYSEKQKALIWERWRKGESLSESRQAF